MDKTPHWNGFYVIIAALIAAGAVVWATLATKNKEIPVPSPVAMEPEVRSEIETLRAQKNVAKNHQFWTAASLLNNSSDNLAIASWNPEKNAWMLTTIKARSRMHFTNRNEPIYLRVLGDVIKNPGANTIDRTNQSRTCFILVGSVFNEQPSDSVLRTLPPNVLTPPRGQSELTFDSARNLQFVISAPNGLPVAEFQPPEKAYDEYVIEADLELYVHKSDPEIPK
jgi:hypothetical protein